jgi:small-conductance mechanosensitive channel
VRQSRERRRASSISRCCLLWWILAAVGQHAIGRREQDGRERYRKRQAFRTAVAVIATIIIILLWARLLQHTGTFLGILGAGLAIALREPLLSIAGRIAIFAAKIYSAGDRIEIDKLSGDVIDVGFFYTRMMEIGNWIGGDQVSGRIVQFANANIFGTPVFNYTRDFGYIWDEVFFPVTYDSNVQEMSDTLISSAAVPAKKKRAKRRSICYEPPSQSRGRSRIRRGLFRDGCFGGPAGI